MPPEYAGPRSLRRLLDAVLSVGSELDLQSVLRRIVEAAVDLVGARYGALGVLNETGTALAEFITVGIEEDAHRAIGALPKGLGLLGALITDARPLRLPDLTDHPDRSGFPPNHPPMTSFLGVPVRVRDEVFGNLYLTDKLSDEVFTDVDEELASGLATAAGVAIENARLFEQVRRREAALGSLQQVAMALVAGTEPLASLRLVAREARELVGGDLATIAVPDDDGRMLVLEITDGPMAPGLAGMRFPRAGSVSGDVLETGTTAVLGNASEDHRVAQPQVRSGVIGPAVFVALMSDGEPFGTLSVARASGALHFTPSDVEMIRSFAAQASVVLELDRTRQRLHRMSLLEDQERIARDLHDSVIQRVFSVGLSLQAVSRLVPDGRAQERVSSAIDELDHVVRNIRTVIFDVEASRSGREELRARILDLTKEAGRALGFDPGVTFDGPIDTLVPLPLADDVIAVLRETLSNATRHARAKQIDVEVSVTTTQLVLRITDDGVGMPPGGGHGSGGHGLRNMTTRAERIGGRFDIAPGLERGTVVEWAVPLAAPEPA